MKTIALLITSALLCVTGCKTTPQQSQSVATKVRAAAFAGSFEYLIANPESRGAFIAARDELDALSKAEHIDGALLLSIAHRLPVDKLKSGHVTVIVTTASLLLEDYVGTIPLDQLENLRPVIVALSDGINLALQIQTNPVSNP